MHTNTYNSKIWRCLQCGKCCALFVFTGVVVTENEWHRVEKDIKSFNLPRAIFEDCKAQRTLPITGKEPPKRCIFLNKRKKCKIHTKRPSRCREYPLMIQEYRKIIRINISEDCPRSSELLDELRKKPPTWLKKKAKNKKLQIVPFSFFDESVRKYLGEES